MKLVKASVGIVLVAAVALILGTQVLNVHALGLMSSQNKTAKVTKVVSEVRVQKATIPVTVPATIAVPAGNTFITRIFGRGALTFACPTSAASAEIPMIITSTDAAETQIIGTHFMDFSGLAWEGLLGDRVIAAPVAKVVVNPNNAPWVLLKATAHTGTGLFSRVTFIQRVNTFGGLPVACTPNEPEVQVPFTTQYLLYGAA